METARSSLERALALFTALEHHRGVGRTLNQLADCDRFSGDLPSAISRNRKALSIFTQIGDRAGQAYAWSALGSCTYRLFHFVEAAGHHRKALELYRWLRHRRGEGYAALGLGECARMQWKHDEASHFLGMARRLFRAVDDRRGEATTLCWLGAVATTQERFDEARSFFEEGLRLVAEIGNPNGQGEILLEYGHCESFAGNPEAALGRYRDCAEIFTTLGQSADAARATRGRARTHLLSGDFEAALRLLEEGLETEDGEWPDHAEVFTWLTVLDTAFGGSTAGRVFLAQGFERVPGRVELLLLADLRRSLRQPVPPRSPHSPDHLGFEARLLTALDDEGTVPSLHQAKTRRDRSAWHCHLRGDLEACRATRSVASPWYVYACLHERLIPYSMLPLRPSEIAEVTRRLTLVADRLDLNHQASGGAPG